MTKCVYAVSAAAFAIRARSACVTVIEAVHPGVAALGLAAYCVGEGAGRKQTAAEGTGEVAARSTLAGSVYAWAACAGAFYTGSAIQCGPENAWADGAMPVH